MKYNPLNLVKSYLSKEKKSVNKDSWANFNTGIGAPNSRVNCTKFYNDAFLDQRTLTALYLNDGLARRIINILVDDAMRSFINTNDELMAELDRLKTKQSILDSASWARLYGGSALVAYVNDGREMDKPLNMNGIRKVISFKSYDRYQIEWVETDLCVNFNSVHYGHPEIYRITPLCGEPIRVHRSRMHLFAGERLPEREKQKNNYWDQSVLQSVYKSLLQYNGTVEASAEIIQDFIQVIIGINGLTDMLAGGDQNLIEARSKLIDLTRSVSRSTFLDSEHETYEKKASSVSGLPDLWDRFAENICSTTGYPNLKLFGKSPGGLNANSESELDSYDNVVDAYRKDEIAPAIDWVVSLIESQKVWNTGKRPTDYQWEFPPLKVSNENELAKNKLMTAQMDAIYMDRGAVDPRFLYESRYRNGSYETDLLFEDDELVKYTPEAFTEIGKSEDLIGESDLVNSEVRADSSVDDDTYKEIIENI